MRSLCTAALFLCLPAQAWADDVLLRADIVEALVYARGAEVTRRVPLDLPAGRHSLLIPMRDLGDPSLVSVTGIDGVQIAATTALDAIPIPEGALDTPAEAEARAVFEAARDAVQTARDTLALRDTDIAGIEWQLVYLEAIARGGPDGAAMPQDPAQLSEFPAALGSEITRLRRALHEARTARRSDEAALEAALGAEEVARIALDALQPFGEAARGLRIDLDAEIAIDGTLALSYLEPGAAWRPSHVLHLDTLTERLDLTHEVVLTVNEGAPWRDVSVRFSTAIPDRRRAPSEVAPDPVRFSPPRPEGEGSEVLGIGAVLGAAISQRSSAAPASAPAALVTNGLAVTYDYAAPVSIGPTGMVTLPLDTLSLDVALENRAVPRVDATAFLVAMGENSGDAPILPGPARFFRDGDLVGTGALPLIPAGGEIEMGFGPLDHLRLFWQDLSLDEGNRGVFVSEAEQRRRIAFGVENTSARAETVRLLYAAPFAEQEDLDLEVGFAPPPDETDVDDLRGVSAWNLDVPAGEEVRIEMVLDLAWEEDMTLDWRP